MISSVSAPAFKLIRSLAAPASAAPAPPQDSLDFSKIDSATKAALLPINEPAVQLTLAVGFMNALMAGSVGQPVPLVTVQVANQVGGKRIKASYTMDLKNEQAPLSVSGSVAGQDISDSLKTDESKHIIHLNGAIGPNVTDLILSQNETDHTLNVDGKLGDIPAHLKFSSLNPSGNDQDFKGFRVDGTMGGQPYSVDAVLDDGAKAKTQARMIVRGKLGCEDITKDYILASQPLPTGASLTLSGSGTTAGVPESVSVTMTISA